MPPLWGFKTFGHSVFYKHVAPLGLKGYFVIPPVYKHAAPLGLKTSPLLTFSLSHFLVFLCVHCVKLC